MNKAKILASLMAVAVVTFSPLHSMAQDAPERVTVTKQVGTYKQCLTFSPLNLNAFQTMSETVYTAQELGLVEGCEIKSIAYDGYSTVGGTAPVQAWIANTTDAVPTTMAANAGTDVSEMTQIYNGDYEFASGGTSAARVEKMRFDLSEPFVYSGGNLRVVVKSQMETKVGAVYFAVSTTLGSFYRIRTNTTDDLSTANFTRTYKPMLRVTYEKDMSYFTGVLRMNRIGGVQQPAAGATITLTSDNGDQYQATTDADGHYRVAIDKDEQTYAVSVSVPGVTIFPVTDQAIFVGKTLEQDVTVTEAADFYINSYDAPATSVVNNRYVATLTATNYNATAMPADDYNVLLYVDGAQVASAQTSDVESMGQQTFSLSYTPHESGSFKGYMQIVGPQMTMTTDEFDIEIAEEFAGGEVQVLDMKLKSTSPFNTYYKHSMSETVYTADKLGLASGSRITELAYMSYKTTDAINAHVQVWIENTDDDLGFTAGRSTDEMTKIYDEVLTIEKHGSTNELEKYIVADLSDNPFVYTGGNLRIVAQCDAASAKPMSFWVDNTYKGTFNKQSDAVEDAQEIAWGTTKANSPVLWLTVESALQLAGKVVQANGDAVANAAVTLTNTENDVIYTATSDENGEFAMTVVRHDLPYVAKATQGNLASEEQDVAFGGENQTIELVLTAPATGVSTVTASQPRFVQGAFTIDGRRVNVDGALPAGIYIINGKKVVIGTR